MLESITTGQFSCPGFYSDLLITYFSFFVPVLVSLAYLATFIINVSNIIVEKETKMKEYLRLVGVRPSVIWIGWVVRSGVVYVPLSGILTVCLVGKYRDEGDGFLRFTSPVLVFAALVVYSVQTTLLSQLVGQIFSRSKKGFNLKDL